MVEGPAFPSGKNDSKKVKGDIHLKEMLDGGTKIGSVMHFMRLSRSVQRK